MFPSHIWRTVARRYPQADERAIRDEVDHALRDWFICCAWRGRRALGMPSRLVDEAWHAFILDSAAYIEFCRAAFGTYLHHHPEGKFDGDGGRALINTVWAWDRSVAGKENESLLWDLDVRHGIEDPWGLTEQQLEAIRTRGHEGGTSHCGVGGGVAGDCPPDGGGANGGGSSAADGASGGESGVGGGCGGGGCGGGGG